MRRRLDQLLETHRRYGHPFCLALFDVAGPATRNGHGGAEAALTVVGAALRDSVRLVDEPFRLEEDALCVLAPNQDTVGGVQMSERLLTLLDELKAAGGLPIEVSAGVVACPEHGTEADALLHNADEAMWRARSVGQPVGVGRSARSLTERRNPSITCVNPAIRWEHSGGGEPLRDRKSDARDTNQRSGRSARRQSQHPAQLGAALRLPDAEADRRATTATTSWSSCRPCATRSPRPATSPRRSS